MAQAVMSESKPKSGYAVVRKCSQCRRMALKDSDKCYFCSGKAREVGQLRREAKRQKRGQAAVNYDIRAQLQRLVSDDNCPAHARASAARTLAELDGLIGKHQQAPERNASAAIEGLSRSDLVAELERLRAKNSGQAPRAATSLLI
jgi:hypothetical protein